MEPSSPSPPTLANDFQQTPRRPPAKFNPHPFAYHQEVELEISTLTNQGQGLGRLDGWVIMVPYALPGEKVRVRIYRNDKNFSEGDLVEVVQSSPHRVQPRCPLFGQCGGCQYQHLEYDEQLAWKQRQVAELLRHMAKLEHPVEPVVASPRAYAYRSKITPHFEKPHSGRMGPIGFLRQGRGRQLVDVPRCEIATGAINDRLQTLRQEVAAVAESYKKGATLLLREAGGRVLTNPKDDAVETVCGLTFEFLAGDFFQNNPFILDAFVQHAVDEAKACGAESLVDAYCGSGLFSLVAAQYFQRVIGVEISASAVEQAKHNARRNSLRHAEFLAGKSESIFSEIPFSGDRTAVIIDPPRAGCDEIFLQQLFAFGPRRVVYVSCNPATQMRDLRLFADYGYSISRVRPFDLFPQTKHLECVVTVDRQS